MIPPNVIVESLKVTGSPIHLFCVGKKKNLGKRLVQNLCRFDNPPVAPVKPQKTCELPPKTVATKSRVVVNRNTPSKYIIIVVEAASQTIFNK